MDTYLEANKKYLELSIRMLIDGHAYVSNIDKEIFINDFKKITGSDISLKYVGNGIYKTELSWKNQQ